MPQIQIGKQPATQITIIEAEPGRFLRSRATFGGLWPCPPELPPACGRPLDRTGRIGDIGRRKWGATMDKTSHSQTEETGHGRAEGN